MLPGLLATALLAPAQPPAPAPAPTPPPAAQPAPVAGPMVAGPPPSIDPVVCPPDQAAPAAGGFSFNTTHAGPPWTLWGGADYRLYWLRPAPAPGVLAVGGGRTLGDRDTEFGRASGVGFDLGGWLNERHTYGLYGSGFLIEQKSRTEVLAGPSITRPVIDALVARPVSFLVADPAEAVRGGIGTSQGIRLSGFEVGGVNNLAYCCDWSADFLAGFRYLDLDEYLTVTQASAIPAGFGLPLAGNRIDPAVGLVVTDRFRTRTQFYGPQVGLRTEYRTGGAFVNLTGKVGIGNTHQRADVDGRTDVTGRPSVPGGLLATYGANAGGSTVNRFAVLLELGASAGYQFAAWGRVKVGYDFLYLNDVTRPGLQVDRTVNSRFVPTSTSFAGVSGIGSPIATGRTDDFFAHGLRFGLELMY
jgi:hypothetical protein